MFMSHFVYCKIAGMVSFVEIFKISKLHFVCCKNAKNMLFLNKYSMFMSHFVYCKNANIILFVEKLKYLSIFLCAVIMPKWCHSYKNTAC